MAKTLTPKEIEDMKAALREPYRIYKPLWLDENNLKRDLDREFENISQSLVWVTNRMSVIEEALRLVLRSSADADVKAYLAAFKEDSSHKTLWPVKK